jgi:hypothetical protein
MSGNMSGNVRSIIPINVAEPFQGVSKPSNLSKENLEAKLFKDMRPLLLDFYLRALGVDVNSKKDEDIQHIAQLKAKLNKMSDAEFEREVRGVLYVSAYKRDSGWKVEVAVLGTHRKLEFAVEPAGKDFQLRLNKWPEDASMIQDNSPRSGWNTNPYIPWLTLPSQPRSREDLIRQMVERGLPEVYADRVLSLIENQNGYNTLYKNGLVDEKSFGLHLNLLLDKTLPWVLEELSDSYRDGRGVARMPEDARIVSFLGYVDKEFSNCKTDLCRLNLANELREAIPRPEKPGDIPQPRGGASNPHVDLALQKRLDDLGIKNDLRKLSFSRSAYDALAKYIARNTDDIEVAIAILNRVHEISGDNLRESEAQGMIKQWNFSNQNGLPNWTAIVDGIRTAIGARKILGGLNSAQ